MNLCNHIGENSQEKCGVQYLENNVQGSDMSFDNQAEEVMEKLESKGYKMHTGGEEKGKVSKV